MRLLCWDRAFALQRIEPARITRDIGVSVATSGPTVVEPGGGIRQNDRPLGLAVVRITTLEPLWEDGERSLQNHGVMVPATACWLCFPPWNTRPLPAYSVSNTNTN